MLFYLFVYLLAAVLLFQGVQALGEVKAPMGVVPAEVRTHPGNATVVGRVLVAFGCVLGLSALLSHGSAWFASVLGPLRFLGFLLLALHGAWLVFGRKVDYTPAPAQAGADHGHH